MVMSLPRVAKAVWLPAVLAVAWVYEPYSSSGPVLCLWRHLLGQECWGCGLTRAFCSLVHAEFRIAAGFNPLVFPAAITMATIYSEGVVKALRDRA
jgi:hypothetical protein